MTYDQVIEHYKGLSIAARALGEDRRAVHNWKGKRIPSRHQLKWERLTEGALNADEQAREEAAEFAGYTPPEAHP